MEILHKGRVRYYETRMVEVNMESYTRFMDAKHPVGQCVRCLAVINIQAEGNAYPSCGKRVH